MKKINIPRIIWVSSIFIVLIIILMLIINYKINYQYLSYNYLYFYECDSNLCVSEAKDSSSLIYSKYECGYESCPKYKKILHDNYVILEKDNKYILYNYRSAVVVSDTYEDYELINDNYIIVTNNKKKGIINTENNLIVDTIYDEIGYQNDEYLSGFNLNNIIVKKDDLYGIISYKNGDIIEDIKYKETEVNTLLDMIKKQ